MGRSPRWAVATTTGTAKFAGAPPFPALFVAPVAAEAPFACAPLDLRYHHPATTTPRITTQIHQRLRIELCAVEEPLAGTPVLSTSDALTTSNGVIPSNSSVSGPELRPTGDGVRNFFGARRATTLRV